MWWWNCDWSEPRWIWSVLSCYCRRYYKNLLGEDFIRHFKCNFDHEDRKLIICKGGKFCEKDSAGSMCKRLARVVSANVTEIPPGCQVVVPACFKDNNNRRRNSCTRCKPDSETRIAAVGWICGEFRTSWFCAIVLNPVKVTVGVQKGTVLGLFGPVSSVENWISGSVGQTNNQFLTQKKSTDRKTYHRFSNRHFDILWFATVG